MENLENIQNLTDSPESLEENTSAADVSPDAPDFAGTPEMRRLIEEAEQRGYLRGRNERIEQEVMQPLDTPAARSDNDEDDDAQAVPSFLTHIRPSFWDL